MRKLTAVCCLVLAATGCTNNRNRHMVSVAAAANLTAPLSEMERQFERLHPDIGLEVSFGASGVLTTQILQGAPYQVFLSADTALPENLHARGLTAGPPAVYAGGSLVLFSPTKRDFTRGLGLLASQDIRIISLANPRTAPYGRAAREALENSNIMAVVRGKITYAQTVAQVVQQTLSAADIGFIAKSSCFTAGLQDHNRPGVYWMEVDPALYSPIRQAAVLLKKGAGNEAAVLFYGFIFSSTAEKVFERYGYHTGPIDKRINE